MMTAVMSAMSWNAWDMLFWREVYCPAKNKTENENKNKNENEDGWNS